MRFTRRYSSTSTRRRNRRLGLSSAPGLNSVTGKQTKLCTTKAIARTRASFVTTFCASLLRNAPQSCGNRKRKRSRVKLSSQDTSDGGQRSRKEEKTTMKLFLTLVVMIGCGLSILAADEEPEAAGEDSSAGLPEQYAKDYLVA